MEYVSVRAALIRSEFVSCSVIKCNYEMRHQLLKSNFKMNEHHLTRLQSQNHRNMHYVFSVGKYSLQPSLSVIVKSTIKRNKLTYKRFEERL